MLDKLFGNDWSSFVKIYYIVRLLPGPGEWNITQPGSTLAWHGEENQGEVIQGGFGVTGPRFVSRESHGFLRRANSAPGELEF